MAAGDPQFGGTNGVTALDIGQIGGTREAAGNATAYITELPGADTAPTVVHRFPQSGVAIADRMGLGGGLYTWRFDIVATTITILRTIRFEIEVYRHGRLRAEAGGVFGAPTPAELAPTQLTNFDGDVVSAVSILETMVISDAVWLGDARAMMTGTLTFRLLH